MLSSTWLIAPLGRYGAQGASSQGDGHCTTLLLMFDNRNSGMKMVLAQDMLLIIVSHDTGDFTSMTTQTLLTVGHNKTIHNDLLFWL